MKVRKLDNLSGNLWYIGPNPHCLSAEYAYEEALQFHHMYYNIDVFKMVKNGQE